MATTEVVVSEQREMVVVETDSGAAFLAMLAAAARDPQVDVAKMRDLLQMQREVMAEQAKIAFSEAMRKTQMAIQPVVRDAENSHTKSRYARLETIDARIRPVYTRHGFSVSFNSPQCDKDNVTVSCTVLHERGHSKDYQLNGPLDVAGSQGKSNKTGIQGLGSTISYLRRYLTAMAFNVVLSNEDNDGNNAGCLTPQELSNITDMMASCEFERDADGKKRFFGYMGVENEEQILKTDYLKAKIALETKMAALANKKAAK